jgi:hypothetical protein
VEAACTEIPVSQSFTDMGQAHTPEVTWPETVQAIARLHHDGDLTVYFYRHTPFEFLRRH